MMAAGSETSRISRAGDGETAAARWVRGLATNTIQSMCAQSNVQTERVTP